MEQEVVMELVVVMVGAWARQGMVKEGMALEGCWELVWEGKV